MRRAFSSHTFIPSFVLGQRKVKGPSLTLGTRCPGQWRAAPLPPAGLLVRCAFPSTWSPPLLPGTTRQQETRRSRFALCSSGGASPGCPLRGSLPPPRGASGWEGHPLWVKLLVTCSNHSTALNILVWTCSVLLRMYLQGKFLVMASLGHISAQVAFSWLLANSPA